MMWYVLIDWMYIFNWNKTGPFQAPFFFTRPRSSPARFPSPLSEGLERAKPKPLRFLSRQRLQFKTDVTTDVN